ncbi:MAG: FG-GAP-like repeat-containing protein [Phycisphaerales bacterium]|nr:FG-GAP-like repeat-containing protein [Phycisphaerales bacterium]
MPDSLRRSVRMTLASSVVVMFSSAADAQQFLDVTSQLFPTPNPSDYTNYIAVGDIDNDDDLDLIFVNGGNFSSVGPAQQMRVFINIIGNGKYADQSATRAAGVTGNYRGVALGDVDRDGDLDIVLSSDFNRQPRLLINDGAGVFTDETAVRFPTITLSSTRAQFADIDNDGDLDIYINNGGTTNRFGCGQNRIFVNDGAGVFTDETNARHPLGNVCEPMDVIFADIDHDFDLDVRTGNRGTNNSKLYRNDGTGIFTDISGNVPSDSTCYSYDFGDMDGDGNLDMLGANAGPNNTELLLKGDGTGVFTNVSGQLSPNPAADDNDSKFFDLDNDGDLDLIIAALFQAREKIYINDGNGNFTQNTTLMTPVSDASLDIAVLDVNSDGRPDIVTAQGESGSFLNRIYLNLTGPQDTIPPDVERTEQLSDTSDLAGPYIVRAAIFDGITSDRGFFDKGVFLHYSVNGGPVQPVEMQWSGNSLWRGEIPGQACGGTVEYFVTAADWNNNIGTGDTKAFTVTGGGPLPAGDINGDCTVDLTDASLLVDVLLGNDTDPDHVMRSDLDNVNGPNGADIQLFVSILTP